MNEWKYDPLSCDVPRLHEYIEKLLDERLWISVKDRLPEQKVLCLWTNGNNFYVAYWWSGFNEIAKQSFFYFDGPIDSDLYADLQDMTHWMPLPKLPEE